jgi:hypothetical protein
MQTNFVRTHWANGVALLAAPVSVICGKERIENEENFA